MSDKMQADIQSIAYLAKERGGSVSVCATLRCLCVALHVLPFFEMCMCLSNSRVVKLECMFLLVCAIICASNFIIIKNSI